MRQVLQASPTCRSSRVATSRAVSTERLGSLPIQTDNHILLLSVEGCRTQSHAGGDFIPGKRARVQVIDDREEVGRCCHE